MVMDKIFVYHNIKNNTLVVVVAGTHALSDIGLPKHCRLIAGTYKNKITIKIKNPEFEYKGLDFKT
jgi:hypothetical protein